MTRPLTASLALFDDGLPTGTAQRAARLASSFADAVAVLTARSTRVDVRAVMRHLHLPRLLGGGAVAKAAVVPVRDGAVHTDLVEEDIELFDAIRRSMPDADAETLASVSQDCRLAVTPYRTNRSFSDRDASVAPYLGGGHGGLPIRGGRPRLEHGVRVLDLTSMWAGPLCTWLLASIGCEVITVEPGCRPDGLRGSPEHFAALAAGKRRVDLDLRSSPDRHRFEDLVATADVVVESFSSRVMPNLGYSPDELRALRPGLTTLSIRAFDADPARRHWVAYGPGVHAASGHAVIDGVPRPAAHAYADALTGFAAATAAVRILTASDAPSSVIVGMDRVIDGLGPICEATEPIDLRALLGDVVEGPWCPVLVAEESHG